ncbi:MAG: hypothetical protein HFI09_01825, partial [Bacilli bacterium]|nr:hypothetical protein [Bacilli bacterium]
AFSTSYDYKRELDSHMMKNTEWGAVTYLQHSKYGSATSVRINNNSAHVTGYASVKEPTCGYTGTNEECNKYGTTENITKPYNTTVGYTASTTGNISGVYDMSGGAYEYVMGVMVDQNGKPMSGRNSKSNSGFNGTFGCPTCDGDTSGLTELTTGMTFPDSKYYDQYAYAENDKLFYRRILGDATGEMGPFGTSNYGNLTGQVGSWHANASVFVTYWAPWYERGGSNTNGKDTGMFAYENRMGTSYNWVGYRVVLSI